jgi:hypothetical protein
MKTKRKRLQEIWLAVFLLLSTVSLSHAGGDTYAFLHLGAGARALGMGNAFVAVCDDGTTVYWNPAGLGFLKNREVTLMYTTLQPDSSILFGENENLKDILGNRYNYISGAFPRLFGRLGIGLNLIQFGVDNIQKTGIDEKTEEFIIYEETFNDRETALMLSVGYELFSEMIALGGNLKRISHEIDELTGTGYGVDIGALANLARVFGEKGHNFLWIFKKVQFGVAAQINSPKKWNVTEADKWEDPSSFGGQYGFSFEPDLGENRRLLFAIAADQTKKQPLKLSGGIELEYGQVSGMRIAIRAGINKHTIETRGAQGKKVKEKELSEKIEVIDPRTKQPMLKDEEERPATEVQQFNQTRQYTGGIGIKIEPLIVDYAIVKERVGLRHRISLSFLF